MPKKRKQYAIILIVVLLVLAAGSFAAKDILRKLLVVELPIELHGVKSYVSELASEPEVQEQHPDVLFITGPDFTLPEAQQSTESERLLREQYQDGTIEKQTCEEQVRFKDKCYLLLARQEHNSYHCFLVKDVEKRDSCYMNYILSKDSFEENDINVCSSITNYYLNQSCHALNEVHGRQTT